MSGGSLRPRSRWCPTSSTYPVRFPGRWRKSMWRSRARQDFCVWGALRPAGVVVDSGRPVVILRVGPR